MYLNPAASEILFFPSLPFQSYPKAKLGSKKIDQGTKFIAFFSLQKLSLLHFLHLSFPGTYPSNPEMPKKLNPTLPKYALILLTLQKALPSVSHPPCCHAAVA